MLSLQSKCPRPRSLSHAECLPLCSSEPGETTGHCTSLCQVCSLSVSILRMSAPRYTVVDHQHHANTCGVLSRHVEMIPELVF